MTSTNPDQPNAGTGADQRDTPDSMRQADRANGEGDGADPTAEPSDETSDDPAVTGVQDGD